MSNQAQLPPNLHLVAPAGERPLYQHDCDCCHFLGRFQGERGPADLYAHTAGHMPTVIARYGSDGPDYSSGASFSYGRLTDLTEARLRAQQLGLWTFNVKEALFYVDPEHAQCLEELRTALPFTSEYQAFLAHETGDSLRHEGLVRHLVQVNHARRLKYAPETTLLASVMEVQGEVVKVVSAYRGWSFREAFEHQVLQSVTEFLYEELLPSARAT